MADMRRKEKDANMVKAIKVVAARKYIRGILPNESGPLRPSTWRQGCSGLDKQHETRGLGLGVDRIGVPCPQLQR